VRCFLPSARGKCQAGNFLRKPDFTTKGTKITKTMIRRLRRFTRIQIYQSGCNGCEAPTRPSNQERRNRGKGFRDRRQNREGSDERSGNRASLGLIRRVAFRQNGRKCLHVVGRPQRWSNTHEININSLSDFIPNFTDVTKLIRAWRRVAMGLSDAKALNCSARV